MHKPSNVINFNDHQKNIAGLKNKANYLIATIQELSMAKSLDAIIEIVRHAARELTGADGATFVLRDKNLCYYVDEDAIGPLWKGKKFPLNACISGWSMLNRQNAVIEDIYQDERIPVDAYRPTFVKSLVMVPIRQEAPIGAIGNYWAYKHKASANEVSLLQSLADSTSIAIENVQLLSELKSSLKSTQIAHNELERQLNLRDEFISIAAHELNTPMTSLVLQTQFLLKLKAAHEFEVCTHASSIDKALTSFQKQIIHLSHLIENLLDVSRIQLGLLAIDRQHEVDLSKILQNIVHEYQQIYPSDITLKLRTNIKGFWDSSKLQQVIRNLLDNAVTFGNNKPICVTLFHRSNNVYLTIEDQGIGISTRLQKRIFERFERTSTIKTHGGMGLGLYISREIIHAHGGTLKVKSVPGTGSCFKIILPYAKSQH